jgi:hypothetical protein
MFFVDDGTRPGTFETLEGLYRQDAWMRLDRICPVGLARETLWKAMLSAIALISISLQLYTGLKLRDSTWPFTGYPMYSPSHHVGDATEIVRLKGVTVEGKTVEITGDDFGLSFHGLRHRLDRRIRRMKKQPDNLEAYAARLSAIYNQTRTHFQEHLVWLEIVYEGRVLGSGGFSAPYSKTIFIYEIDS